MGNKMNFKDIAIGVKYMAKTIGGWREVIVAEKLAPRKGMKSDYYLIKWKYEYPNMFGCVGGVCPSKDGMFDIKPL